MVRISDMRQKEVINIADGKRLGFVYDLDINLDSGLIEAVIVPGNGKMMGLFGKNEDYVIPWDQIQKIGDDIILVDLENRTIRRPGEK